MRSNWNVADRNQKSKKQHPRSRLCRICEAFHKEAAQETLLYTERHSVKLSPPRTTVADEVESTMLKLTPAQHTQETQDDKSWKTYKLTSTASESHQVMDSPLTLITSGSLKDILKEPHDFTFVMKDDSPGLKNRLSKWIPIQILKTDWIVTAQMLSMM